MNPLLALLTATAVNFSVGGLLGILLWCAIAAVCIWAIYALLQWSGIAIPPPVRIIFIALVCIVLIILMFRFAGIAT